MPRASTKGTAAIQRLLDERRQFEAWIARLDAAGDATPAAVRGRVRADYETRLRAVTDELRTHMDAVRQVVAQRRIVLGEQQTKEARAAERLAEAELRHAVGEYDEGQWTQVHKDALSELVSIREELQTITTEVERLEELEAMVSETAAAPPPPPPPPPPPEPPVMESEPALTVVSDRAAGRGASPRAPQPPLPRPAEERKGEKKHQPVDELAFLKSVTEDARGGAPAMPPSPPARHSGAQHRPAEPPPPPPTNSPPGMSVRSPRVTPQEVDPVIVEEGEEPVKTLRCKDCGTMNLPTEWYCENCGAELAAL